MTDTKVASPNEPITYKQRAFIGTLVIEKATGKKIPEINRLEASNLISEMINGEGMSVLAAKLIDD